MAASGSPQRSTNDQIAEIAERHAQRYQWGDDTLHGAVTQAARDGFALGAAVVAGAIAGRPPWIAYRPGDTPCCYFCNAWANQDHFPGCIWASAKEAVGEEVTRG